MIKFSRVLVVCFITLLPSLQPSQAEVNKHSTGHAIDGINNRKNIIHDNQQVTPAPVINKPRQGVHKHGAGFGYGYLG